MTEEEFKTTFTDENSCVCYMRSRLESIGVVCPKCGKRPSYFDYYNRGWRCERCNVGWSLTGKTVMAYSKFPLKHWITAIYMMSGNANLLAKDLQDVLNENAPNHVRVMMLRIRSAMSQYLKENGIRRRLPAAVMSKLRSEHHGIHDENLDLYRDELVFKKSTIDVDDKFKLLLDICLTHTTDVKLKR